MRITFVIASADLAGGCKVVAIYAQRLIARGHDVIVVAPPGPNLNLRAWARGIVKGGAPLRLPQLGRQLNHLDLMDVPRHYLDRYRPVRESDVPDADVIVATWWETALWIRDLPRRKGAKAYFIQGNEADLEEHPERVTATWELPYQRITISSWLAGLLRDRAGAEDVLLVPNSVDRAQFDAPPRGKYARPTLGTSYSPLAIKGFAAASRAIEIVRRELPDLRVVLLSSYPVDPIMPLPRDAEFNHRPPQDRLREVYASADVWLSTSRREGFGLPALEAMACRTPLVSTRYGGPADFVRDGENGFLVDVDDAEALAARALTVLRAPEAEWKRLSDAAYASAHGYTWDDAAARMESALRRAMAIA